jgi:hypothetical protein
MAKVSTLTLVLHHQTHISYTTGQKAVLRQVGPGLVTKETVPCGNCGDDEHKLEPADAKASSHNIAVDPQPAPQEQQVSSRLTTPFSSPAPTELPPMDILPLNTAAVTKAKSRFNCEKCCEPLTGQFVKIAPKDQRFHLECFTCAVSTRVFIWTCL